MRLIMNGFNGEYLQDIMNSCAGKTEEVLAAVAYATPGATLFDWCWDNKIPLKFYGRLDEDIAVSTPVLSKFLMRKSQNFVCRLVQHHHAKVIWWRGVGIYIGSANLTDSAWTKNVEVGCYFSEEEITDKMANDILSMFKELEANSTKLSDELLALMKKREKDIYTSTPKSDSFWNNSTIIKWPGLITTAAKSANSRRKDEFLKEWYDTLQELRDIGSIVSLPENRPRWVSASVPPGAQADQFLHAHYYQRTFDGRKANYIAHYEKNNKRKEDALIEAMDWWRNLPEAPSDEDIMLHRNVPLLRKLLSQDSLETLTYDKFKDICSGVYSIKDYSRRVPNNAVGLAEDGSRYTIAEKVEALSKRIWSDRSSGGLPVHEILLHVLYNGSDDQLPERLWQAVTEPKWKIDGLGISAFGELVGWALPDRFPPRNGRTSKALKSLGYDVTVHVGA